MIKVKVLLFFIGRRFNKFVICDICGVLLCNTFDFRLIKISLNIVVVNIMMVFYVIDDEIYICFSVEFYGV